MTGRLQFLLASTAVKIAAVVTVITAALSSAAPAAPRADFPLLLSLGQVLALAVAGAFLLVGGQRDPRAVSLGGVCLLLAAAKAPTDALGWHQNLPDPAAILLFGLLNLRFEIFFGPLLGQFVRDFPAASLSFETRHRIERILLWSWRITALLFAFHLLWLVPALARPGLPADGEVDPTFALAWGLNIFFGAAAIAFLIAKRRRTSVEERRRGRLFVGAAGIAGTVFGLGLLVDFLSGPRIGLGLPPLLRNTVDLLGDAVLIAIPFTVAYAVLVERVLDVRGLARRTVQRALARSTARLLVAAPFAVLAFILFEERHLTLGELFAGRPLALLGAALLGGLGLRYHQHLLDGIDRFYFPEQYNARRILEQLPAQIRDLRDAAELARSTARGVGLAWRIDRVTLLLEDGERYHLIDPSREIASVERGAELPRLLEAERRPLEVDLGSPASVLRGLPEAERHWLVDARARLIAPAFAADGHLDALLMLGAKARDLPFAGEERDLLARLCTVLGQVAELPAVRQSATAAVEQTSDEGSGIEILASDRKATECLACGRVYPPGAEKCRKCNIDLAEATVPYALRQLYRFEERIGTGGMAVVYRATDLELGRSVAIKTLPRVSPEAAIHLQREARTAATVSHPGLAAIFGLETWCGTPMLILEYLESGTLGDRMAEGPISALEAIETGQAVAQGLEVIHSLGILHRDIKPSNIGYTRHGAAKLLDFGIARLYQDLRSEQEDPSERITVDWRMMQSTDNITGTLCYFSPEALDEEPPDPTFDLWSLAVVLYEAMTARNLFYRPRLKDMLAAIRQAEVPDLRVEVPDCPPALAEFFAVELGSDKASRSQSGQDFRRRLERIRRDLCSQPPGHLRSVAPAAG